jgi:hypothetical protein
MIPDLIVFKKTGGRFFSYFHIKNISSFFVRKGDEVVISKEGKETDNEGDESQREDDTIQADSSCLKGNDFTMAGEGTKGEESGKQNCIGNRPLERNLWDFIKEVFKNQSKRGLIFMEKIDLLEK